MDPYDLSIKFRTIEKIARNRVDFLFVLALHMDANRNLSHYLDDANHKVDDFLGTRTRRDRWRGRGAATKFPRFLAEEYARRMESLGYLHVPIERMKQVRSDVQNLPLYHLALFSKHHLAYDYWEQVLKYGTDQRLLF